MKQADELPVPGLWPRIFTRDVLMTNSATRAPLIRPAWTPATIALMVLGFMVFWPLGLAMLAYILWGDRLEDFKTDVNRATDRVFDGFSNATRGRSETARSGNVAFDDWREAELARLEEERRKLDETRKEFDDYQRDLRKARDAEEFDAFMKARRSKPPRGRNSGGDLSKD